MTTKTNLHTHDSEAKKTLAEIIMHKLANKIIDGEFVADEKLPSERELAQQFEVTRGRIREALRALSLVGLVVIKPNDGIYVASTTTMVPKDTIMWLFHQTREDIDHLYEARKLIEKEVIKSAFQNISSDELKALCKINEEIQTFSLLNNTVDHYNTLTESYDLFMGKISGNSIYDKLMQTIILLRSASSLRYLAVPGAIEKSIYFRNKITQAFIEKNSRKLNYALNDFYSKSKFFYTKIL